LLFNQNIKKSDFFCQILNQELDSAVGTRPDTKLCQILDQEPKTFPGTKSSSSGTKLSTLAVLLNVTINLQSDKVASRLVNFFFDNEAEQPKYPRVLQCITNKTK
jgi:hypothetical protein